MTGMRANGLKYTQPVFLNQDRIRELMHGSCKQVETSDGIRETGEAFFAEIGKFYV